VLGIFSLAITPWAAFHHHDEVVQTTAEKNCTHKFHVKTQKETCLICAAHFEKHYTVAKSSFVIYLFGKLITAEHPMVSSSFTELISTSLRGPPSFS